MPGTTNALVLLSITVKAGSPFLGVLLVTTIAVAQLTTAAPPNDDFQRRSTLLTSRMAVGSTDGATHEPGEPDHGHGVNSASVWWTWTAPSNGLYALQDGSYAQLERIYTGESLANLSPVLSREVPLSQSQPRLEFEGTATVPYQIAVDEAAGRGSSYGLLVFPVPPNDHFVNRVLIQGTSNVVHASAANATPEPGEPSGVRSWATWWSWVSPGEGAATVTSTNPLTWVQVFTNRTPASSVALSNLSSIHFSLSYPRFAAASNVIYYLAAGSTDWTNHTIDFTLTFNALPQLSGQWHPPEFQWRNSPFNPWFRQTSSFFDGPDAAESGHAEGKYRSTMYATIVGPGLLSFWWKVSATDSNRNLFFTQDPWQTETLAGPRDWSRHTVWIGPGTNTLDWAFHGKPWPSSQSATAWVDRVEFVPGQAGAAVLNLRPPNVWGDLILQINGELDRPYQLEMSTNLIAWTLWTNVVRLGPYSLPQVPVATNQAATFFRATTQ